MESTGSSLLVLLLLITLAGSVVSRSPLVRAPRDAPTTGEYMVVAKRDITAEQFDSLLARVSELSDDRSIHRYVDNVGKVITVALSPYTLEAVSEILYQFCIFAFYYFPAVGQNNGVQKVAVERLVYVVRGSACQQMLQ